ncbi:MAG: alpha/beta hydrolase [Rhodospirillales bacterium]
MALALLLLAATLALSACAPGRSVESLSLLGTLAGGEQPEEVRRVSVSFRGQSGLQAGDLYRASARPPEAALMILPGASPNGRDDPRVVAFAAGWADAGFLVLVPEIENLRRLQVSVADAAVMADSLRYLAHLIEPEQPLGAFGLSYAVGPLMLALLQPDLAQRVDFLVALGGYHSTESVATYFTTGAHRLRPQDPWRRSEPDGFGTWVFALSNAGRLSDPEDSWRIKRIAQRRLDDPSADIAGLSRDLGPEGQAVLAFLDNRDPEAVPQLREALPAGIREEMTALDLSRQDLSGPGPELLLIHGKKDSVIPYTESLALARAVNGEGGERAELYLLDEFRHTDLGRTTLGDVLMLSSALYRVLEIRDGVMQQDLVVAWERPLPARADR